MGSTVGFWGRLGGSSAWLVCALMVGNGCEDFDPAPSADFPEQQGAVIQGSAGDPFVIQFSEDIKLSSLKMMVVRADKRLDIDPEGFLPDEPQYCETARRRGQCEGDRPTACCTNEGLVKLMSFNGATGESEGGSFELVGRTMTIDPADGLMAIAIPYMIVIEPGLEDKNGNVTVPRQKLEFNYGSFVPGPSSLPSGPYFLLFDINPPPLRTQLRLFGWLNVDANTGDWEGLFTDGNRTAVLNDREGCPNCDDAVEVCKLFPVPECVKASTNIATIDEWPDLTPVKERPVGYTFQTTGFSGDLSDGSIGFSTPPFDIDIVIGSGSGVRITAINTQIVAQAREEADGRFRGSGNVTIEAVAVNGIGEESTDATLSFMNLTAEEQTLVEQCGYPEPPSDGRPCEPIYKPGDIE